MLSTVGDVDTQEYDLVQDQADSAQKILYFAPFKNKISEICRVSPAYNAENATVSQDVQPVWLSYISLEQK